jgi:hypothetical protein
MVGAYSAGKYARRSGPFTRSILTCDRYTTGSLWALLQGTVGKRGRPARFWAGHPTDDARSGERRRGPAWRTARIGIGRQAGLGNPPPRSVDGARSDRAGAHRGSRTII